MENQIIEMLKQEILTSQDIALKLGKRKVKDIQRSLNKLLTQKMIKKDKIGNQFQWSLIKADDEVKGGDVSVINIFEESFQEQEKFYEHENQDAKLPEINPGDSYTNLLKLVNSNFIGDILFLRKEVERKNELIASQQQIINMLVLDQQKQRVYQYIPSKDDFIPCKKTFKPSASRDNPEKPFGRNSRYQPLYNVGNEQSGKEDQDNYNVNDFNDDLCYLRESNKESEIKKQTRMEDEKLQSKSTSTSNKRPSVVVYDHPERNHFNDNNHNYKKDVNIRRKPLILLVGDSTIKNISGYQLKQNCKDTNIMVRSHVGGKIKNIKNLIIDMLEDVKPNAVCIHVATNDISSGRSIDEIVIDMENLVDLIQRQGIVPVISLITQRADKFSSKVEIINKRLIILCNHLGVGYIDHTNITKDSLNTGGLHIARENTSLFSNNFAKFFNYLTENNFCLQ